MEETVELGVLRLFTLNLAPESRMIKPVRAAEVSGKGFANLALSY